MANGEEGRQAAAADQLSERLGLVATVISMPPDKLVVSPRIRPPTKDGAEAFAQLHRADVVTERCSSNCVKWNKILTDQFNLFRNSCDWSNHCPGNTTYH